MKKIKSKLNLKQIVKKCTSLLSAFLIGISTIPITSNTITAQERATNIVATSSVTKLNYIKYTDGNALYFPVITTSNGKYGYCLEHSKTTPDNLTYTSGGTLDNGINYILENGLNTIGQTARSSYLLGNDNYDYYITQTAIKIYLGASNGGVSDTYMSYSTGDSRILGNARALANDARYRNIEKLLTASITPASQDFYLDGDYFRTNNFTVNTSGTYTGYQVVMSGASADVEVINSNTGQIMTNQQISPNTPFYLRIHKSKATQNLSIALGVRIWYMEEVSNSWIPSTSSYQRISTLEQQPTQEEKINVANANLQAVGNVQIIKTSEDGVVNGIEFNIQGNGINQNVTTGADGSITIPDLVQGTYTVTEITPAQYIEPQAQTVTVTAGQTATVTFSNVLKRGNVELYKVDKETGASLNGATFELYKDVNENGLLDNADTLIGNLQQENNRHYYNDLIYGKYLVKEVAAPNGYFIDKNVYPFSIINNGQTITITNNNNGTFSNMAQKGHLKITKFGEVFNGADFRLTEYGLMYSPIYINQGLQGTIYKIYANEDIYTADGTLRYEKGQVVDTITTDENGQATSIDLYIGKYIGVEWTATEDFVRNPETFEFEIKYAGQEIEFSPDVNLEFTNQRQKLEIELTKWLEANELFNIGLADEYTNVFFGLFASEDIIDDLGNVAI